ncbi:conserved hypothetical protein [Yersinia pestis KIM D27]|uniref:Uncharacterized protein n=1 Tax=Yersinia pseudotuberculosis serotype O:1b (strain IP 31758) TaxID=349747 RepID=A0A0U1R390_YERP3|nr:hypothetical protein YpsIP31758_2709 [Yersinia pseudotuberculosis IP 31758]EFA46374.1 conserved hypothetical protein [Yersinia pestis KIM D27]
MCHIIDKLSRIIGRAAEYSPLYNKINDINKLKICFKKIHL